MQNRIRARERASLPTCMRVRVLAHAFGARRTRGFCITHVHTYNSGGVDEADDAEAISGFMLSLAWLRKHTHELN